MLFRDRVPFAGRHLPAWMLQRILEPVGEAEAGSAGEQPAKE